MQPLDPDIARRLAELGLGFPSLRDSPLRTGFDPEQLDRWGCDATREPQAFHAVAFLLSVFSATPGRGLLALQRYLVSGLRDAFEEGLKRLESDGASREELLAAARAKRMSLACYCDGDRQAALSILAKLGDELASYFGAARRYLEEERRVSELDLLRWYTRHVFFRVGAFDVIGALDVWDEAHRAVFVGWCRAPFYATFLPPEVCRK